MNIGLLVALALAVIFALGDPACADERAKATSVHGLTIAVGPLKRTGDAIRESHVRTVTHTGPWLAERRFLQTPTVLHTRIRAGWVPYRSPYAYKTRLVYLGSGLYTLRAPFRYDFSCRFLADCPCRYLAGC